eukprot:Selendium_serpulae@DN6181_c1_g4_i3.p1
MHSQRADLPEEDMLIMEHMGRCYSIACPIDIPKYRQWLFKDNALQLRSAYKFHYRFLQHLAFQRSAPNPEQPNLRWLLKMPFHLFALDTLFETYPDAHVIFTHRDPKETLPSWVGLVNHARSLLSQREPDIKAIAAEEMGAMSDMIQRAIRFRKNRPDLADRFHDVSYSEFIQDPLQTVKNLYGRLHLDYNDQLHRILTDFIATDSEERQKKPLSTRLTLTDIGLDPSDVETAFKSYYEAPFSQQLLSSSRSKDQNDKGPR